MGRIFRPLRKFFTAGRGRRDYRWWWAQRQNKDRLADSGNTPGTPDPLVNVSFLMNTEGESPGSQNITDASYFSHTVTVTGNTNIQADSSVYFDGDGDYFTIPHDDSISIANAYDMEFEVEFNWDGDGDTTQNFFNKRDGAQAEEFRMTINGGVIEFITFVSGSADVNLVGGTSLVSGTWYNFKAKRVSGEWTILLDDVADAAPQTESAQPSANGAPLNFGHSAFNSSRQFKGFVRIAQITQIVPGAWWDTELFEDSEGWID